MNETKEGIIPPGDYNTKVVVVDDNIGMTTLEIVDGPYVGRRLLAHTWQIIPKVLVATVKVLTRTDGSKLNQTNILYTRLDA